MAELMARGLAPTGLSADSRAVGAGDLFVAYRGFRTDGRRHGADAVARGACGVLWDADDGLLPPDLGVPVIPVSGLRGVSGHLAHRLYGAPSEKLWLVGVTGTNGKTTVSQWLARALTDLGQRCGVVGTLGCGFPGKLDEASNTTPDAPALHHRLADFRAQGAVATAMEVSSIGLDQGRVNGAVFGLTIFTNLTRDHLDYHGSMEAYAAAKARLFDLPGARAHVLNLDDAFGVAQGRRLLAAGHRVVGYTLIPSNADAVAASRVLVADNLRPTPAGMRFTLGVDGREAEVHAPVVARFNISNLLAVMAALLERGIAPDDVLAVAGRLSAPEGRMQVVGGVGEPLVVVDYAHTPDALAKVLEAVRATAEARGGRLVCVFGCGGDRDPGKRPLMGEVARNLADRVVMTSDNPRGEDPEAILDAVAAGAGPTAERICDRASAIRAALVDARADDVVVIAGKGHEPYQEVQGERLPFSDLSQAREALAAWHEPREGLTP
ncbi:MAG: UDP-N-acetylmuramoyl-L-alanyl-D-glutamate--2,6-diaminopimelate ligase [Rhodocyclaceae bacterium]|nr:UDP-N-acetylmuramoyl-L-alanyl-D-glutamate--2,6-diaminopimelate ligase [Rhodocyclaceae bacterium]